MEILLLLSLIILYAIFKNKKVRQRDEASAPRSTYRYKAKEHLMTASEEKFFMLLSNVVKERYVVFPQIHLSAILDHKIDGQDYKWAFRNIHQYSVDYVLCDKETLKPIYAIELDDYTHRQPKRVERDKKVEYVLLQAGVPLARFNHISPSKDEIIRTLHDAKFLVTGHP